MNFGGKTPEPESMEIIDKAIDQGLNFLDTANVYSLCGPAITLGLNIGSQVKLPPLN